jgi:predicted P-loop ATPase
MVVLENPLQGTDKSSALELLAVDPDWFSDSLPLNADDKKVIETLSARWIVQAAELKGLRKGDIEHLRRSCRGASIGRGCRTAGPSPRCRGNP